MSNTTKTTTVLVRHLRVGDLVQNGALCIRVTTAPAQTRHEDGNTYAAAGVVENADELRLPNGRYIWPYTGLIPADRSWTLQGNGLRGVALVNEAVSA